MVTKLATVVAFREGYPFFFLGNNVKIKLLVFISALFALIWLIITDLITVVATWEMNQQIPYLEFLKNKNEYRK